MEELFPRSFWSDHCVYWDRWMPGRSSNHLQMSFRQGLISWLVLWLSETAIPAQRALSCWGSMPLNILHINALCSETVQSSARKHGLRLSKETWTTNQPNLILLYASLIIRHTGKYQLVKLQRCLKITSQILLLWFFWWLSYSWSSFRKRIKAIKDLKFKCFISNAIWRILRSDTDHVLLRCSAAACVSHWPFTLHLS